jgi:ParB-like chromosome segregation protein Spo0J
MMSKVEIESLAKDIAVNGVGNCGCLYQGKILDGRNRYAACQIAGVEMQWEDADMMDHPEKFDAMAYVITTNLHRRHLKQGQRAMIAAKMATLKHGGDRKSEEIKGSNDTLICDAAALLSVSEPTVKRAKHVLANGCKQLIEAVEACDITVSMAEKLCKACDDKREQSKLVKDGKDAIKLFLNPTPHEQPTASDSVDGESDEYDYPVVKAFKVADYRLNTLKMIIDNLEPHEIAVVREWVASCK